MTLVINFLTGAPRSPAPAAPGPSTSGDGRFGKLLNDLWESENQSGDFLGDASPTPDDGQQAAGKTVADVFNQHGLMAQDVDETTSPLAPGGVPTLARTNDTVTADNTSSSDSAELMSSVTPAGPIAITVVPSENDAASRESEIDFGAPLRLPLQSAAIGHVTAEPLSASESPKGGSASFAVKLPGQANLRFAPIAQQLINADEGDIVERIQSSLREPPEEGATSAAQVTLGLTEQGATIVARVAEGGQPERMKLRERMAALVARFGLHTGEVRLNGTLIASVVDTPREDF